MKQRGSNTGYGSQHMGEGRSQVAKAPLPRLLSLPWPEVCSSAGSVGMRRTSTESGLGVSMSSMRRRRPAMHRVQGSRDQTTLQVSTLDGGQRAQGDTASCGLVDSGVYALRHAQCSTSSRRLAGPDAQLPLLRGSYRRRERLLGGISRRRTTETAQRRRVSLKDKREQG